MLNARKLFTKISVILLVTVFIILAAWSNYTSLYEKIIETYGNFKDQKYGEDIKAMLNRAMKVTKDGNILAPGSFLKEKPALMQPLASRELKPSGEAPPDEELERIWNYIYQRQYHCTDSKYLGGNKYSGDGAYDLCVEKQFWPFPNEDSKCLVYSFGVGGDFTFDDEMANQGCEVHSFDPSMDYPDGMVRKSGVRFHKIGISSKDDDHGYNDWKMRTLKTLLRELGHEGRTLDYLKVDTDRGDGQTGFEDMVMDELIETGLYKCVRQYAMEIHMAGPIAVPRWLDRCRLLYQQMRRLNDGGWRLFNTTDNVRAMRSTNPIFTQRMNKEIIVHKSTAILWETAFVNFDVAGACNTVAPSTSET